MLTAQSEKSQGIQKNLPRLWKEKQNKETSKKKKEDLNTLHINFDSLKPRMDQRQYSHSDFCSLLFLNSTWPHAATAQLT